MASSATTLSAPGNGVSGSATVIDIVENGVPVVNKTGVFGKGEEEEIGVVGVGVAEESLKEHDWQSSRV